jgi:hypothetical protein
VTAASDHPAEAAPTAPGTVVSNPEPSNPESSNPVAPRPAPDTAPTAPGTLASRPVAPRPAPDTAPLLLVPVRLETRFVDAPTPPTPPTRTPRAAARATGGTEITGPELWVRVYPDQISVDSHQTSLTTDEAAAAAAYWTLIWAAGNPPADPDAPAAAWRGLVAQFGAQRSAWIVRATAPVNAAEQPAAPAADGAAPQPAPQLTPVTTVADSWQQPAVAALLPDAWTVELISGATTSTFTGSPISADLALSLSPADGTVSGGFPDGMPVDAGMRWLVDFDAAVAAGMGLRIPLTAAQRAAGFDRVLVYGLSAGSEPGGAARFAAALDAHHYTDGLAFVAQGANTKNTADGASAYTSQDPDCATSFAVELGAPLTADPAADGPTAAALLGVPTSVFDHVQNADRHDQHDGGAMITALWPATLGYFLSQMADGKLTDVQIEQARQWVTARVRPHGPLPALRTGLTPYGILPVTSLADWAADGDDPVAAAVGRVVARLQPIWAASAAGAPHLGATPGDPDADLAAVLGEDASSAVFRGRHTLGDELLWNLMEFYDLPAAAQQSWWTAHLTPSRTVLDSVGLTAWDPRAAHTGLLADDFPVNLPTVIAGPLSETDPLPADATVNGKQVNYIEWILSASIEDLRGDAYPGASAPNTLLYLLLRQSMLLDYVTIAQRAQIADGRLLETQTREQELVGIAAAVTTPQITDWQVLDRPVSTSLATSWGAYLVALNPAPGGDYQRLIDLRTALTGLAALPTAELDRLLTETLDVFSHRLDAWITALATERLSAQRAAGTGTDPGSGAVGGAGNGTGAAAAAPLGLGAYGWVENLRPAPGTAPAAGPTLERVEAADAVRARQYPNGPVPRPALTAPADNGGFIHAPSPLQAAAAAVLRSGYLSHQGQGEDGLLAIDLSSERTGAALRLLDGVRQGQALGALLGYQLETAMHDAGLDKYIQPLRDLFPLVGDKLTPAAPDQPAVAAPGVVDGLALDRARQDGTLAPTAAWSAGLPGLGADRTALLGLFAVLDDTVDALGDLGLAEAVFQVIQGNADRAGGTLNALSQAQRSPEPQIVATPRPGIDQTHRVAALFTEAPARAAAWSGAPNTPRALAEPWLDAWISTLLPDPASVQATVSYTDGGGQAQTATVTLAQLGIAPLDVLAMSRTTGSGAGTGGRSELDARVLYQVLPSQATNIVLSYQEPPAPVGGAAPAAGFADLLVVARAVDDFLGGARALTAADLALPETPVPSGIDTADLNARAAAATAGLTTVVSALASAATAGTSGDPDTARAAIAAASWYGVPTSLPASSVGSGPDPTLAAQAASLQNTLAQRLTAADAVTLDPADPAPALGVLGTVFDNSVTVLPRFAPADPATLQAGFGQDPAALGADPDSLQRWIQQLTHVRPGVSRLDLALLFARVVGGAAPPAPRIAQLPAAAQDRWLALPPAPGATPVNGRAALVAFLVGDPAAGGTAPSWSGLFVDGWPERVPLTTVDSAVAFHHADPASRAPQALLLAVCPDPASGWSPAVVRAVLSETLDLARARAVSLDRLGGGLGQLLPALYLPFNLQEDTVSIRLTAGAVRTAPAPAAHRAQQALPEPGV